MAKRLYKSGSRWALWRWTFTDAEYITRLHLVKTPWFSICLHWFNKPDPEPYLHDHPVSFLSIILKGWYKEHRERLINQKFVGPTWNVHENLVSRWWNYFRATPNDRHSIKEIAPGTMTLCFMGPKKRDWGFHTNEGWVFWKDYNKAKYG